MSKKHTRKPAPLYPPSWFDARRLIDDINPLAMAIADTMRERARAGTGWDRPGANPRRDLRAAAEARP